MPYKREPAGQLQSTAMVANEQEVWWRGELHESMSLPQTLSETHAQTHSLTHPHPNHVGSYMGHSVAITLVTIHKETNRFSSMFTWNRSTTAEEERTMMDGLFRLGYPS